MPLVLGIDQLIANINFGKVLIVYAVYNEVRGENIRVGASGGGEPHYLAIVGHEDAPLRAVALGAASTIDDASKAFLTAVGQKPRDQAPFDHRPAEALYTQILAPLKPYFAYKDVQYVPTLIISADGSLLGIPFAALVEDGKFLVEKYGITLIDSPNEANLLPRFNLDPSTTFLTLADPVLAGAARANYKPLAQADLEADQIAMLWPSDKEVVLHGRAASVAALEAAAAGAGVIHIASHGVLAPGLKFATGARIISQQDIATDKTGLMASFLARSVVLLSPTAGHGDAGLLSGLDVLRLDLSRTQLVVLSACDTDLGDTERGEGIYGLRRAVLEAGAETVVSSLWEVDSEATRELMVAFYRNLFQGEGRAAALQNAAAFTRLKHKHPYYWAAFVLAGSDARLKLPTANRGG